APEICQPPAWSHVQGDEIVERVANGVKAKGVVRFSEQRVCVIGDRSRRREGGNDDSRSAGEHRATGPITRAELTRDEPCHEWKRDGGLVRKNSTGEQRDGEKLVNHASGSCRCVPRPYLHQQRREEEARGKEARDSRDPDNRLR